MSAELLLLFNITMKKQHVKKRVLNKPYILYFHSWWKQTQLSISSHLAQILHLF